MAWKSSQSPSHQQQGDSPHNMGLSIRETLLFVALALLASATITNAQLDYSKSFFLLTGQIEGSVTLSSLTRVASHYPLPPYSQDVAIQALTDVVNSRFLVLSGESLGAQGVNYTFSNISYTESQLTIVNSFVLPSSMRLVDTTYDLTLKQPVSLIQNGTNVCNILIGYGPVLGQPLSLTGLFPCDNATTLGSVLKGNQMVTVAPASGVAGYIEICFGATGSSPVCRERQMTISNLIGATDNPPFFPTVYTVNNETVVGIFQTALMQFRAIYTLPPGTLADNFHMPSYWDPINLVFAGAWRTAGKILLFAATWPIVGFFAPPPVEIPQGSVIGLTLAYRPVPTPRAAPFSEPLAAPVSSNHTGVIVGSVIGGLAALGLLAGIIIFVRRNFSFQYRRL